MFAAGKWYARGDFLYLRLRLEDSSGPYDTLRVWHIDSMSSDEVHMSQPEGRATLKRSE
jgi:hypothetical protein